LWRALIDAGAPSGRLSLGGLLLLTGDYQEAAGLLRPSQSHLPALAAALDGQLGEAATGLGQLEVRQKRAYDGAGEGWRLVDTLLARAHVALLQGRVSEAERFTKRAMARTV